MASVALSAAFDVCPLVSAPALAQAAPPPGAPPTTGAPAATTAAAATPQISTPAPAAPRLDLGMGLRAGVATGREGWGMDTIDLRVRVAAALQRGVGLEAGVGAGRAVVPLPPIGFEKDEVKMVEAQYVALLDAIVKVELGEHVNVWVGRFLPPSDRSNLTGGFFLNAWNYPSTTHLYPSLAACHGEGCLADPDTARRQLGTYTNPFTGQPASELDSRKGRLSVRTGRDEGAAVWGHAAGRRMKYQAGVFNLRGNPTHDVRPAARLTWSFVDPEPGYYEASTYYGDRDVLTVGVSGQYQRNGVPVDGTTGPPDNVPDELKDLMAAEVDVLLEKRLGTRGVFTLEAAYYNFTEPFPRFGANYPLPDAVTTRQRSSFFVLGSYLFPKTGPGRLQPLVRYQMNVDRKLPVDSMFTVDAFLNYVLAGHDARVSLGYQYIFINEPNTPMWVQLGLQVQR